MNTLSFPLSRIKRSHLNGWSCSVHYSVCPCYIQWKISRQCMSTCWKTQSKRNVKSKKRPQCMILCWKLLGELSFKKLCFCLFCFFSQRGSPYFYIIIKRISLLLLCVFTSNLMVKREIWDGFPEEDVFSKNFKIRPTVIYPEFYEKHEILGLPY